MVVDLTSKSFLDLVHELARNDVEFHDVPVIVLHAIGYKSDRDEKYLSCSWIDSILQEEGFMITNHRTAGTAGIHAI